MQFKEVFYMAVSLIMTAILITVCVLFTRQARDVEIQRRDEQALTAALRDERYWRKFEGEKTGADVVDFIVRHREMCDIVIRDNALAADQAVSGYTTGNTLIMGLADTVDVPDEFWEVGLLYHHIIGGDGERVYTATLLYDGQLAPEYDGGTQVRGGVVTGVEFVG